MGNSTLRYCVTPSAEWELRDLDNIECREALIAQRNGLQAKIKRIDSGKEEVHPEDLEHIRRELRTLLLDHPWLKDAQMPAGPEAA